MSFKCLPCCALLPLFILVACDQAPEVVPVVPVPEVDEAIPPAVEEPAVEEPAEVVVSPEIPALNPQPLPMS